MKRTKVAAQPAVQLLWTDAAAVGAPVYRRRSRLESGVVVAVRVPPNPYPVEVRVCIRQGGRFFVPDWESAQSWYLDEREPLGLRLADACLKDNGCRPPPPTKTRRARVPRGAGGRACGSRGAGAATWAR